MRTRGYWVVSGGILIAQLGCGGDASSVDRGRAAVPGNEPGEGATPDEPVAPGEAPTPVASGEAPTPGEALTPAEVEPPASVVPATPGEPPPFNGPESSSCFADPEFVVDTPLNDTRGTGFSALDMLSIFNEQGPGTLTWLDGTTTALSIAALAAGDTSAVDDPPRGEGHCVPFRWVPVQLRIESADGRLAEDVTAELVAVGYDGNIESIWVSAGYLPLDELQGDLDIPSDWLIAGHTERHLAFDTAWAPPEGLSPFCTLSDVPSTDPSETCNVYTGVVRFYSSTPYLVPAEDLPGAVDINPAFDDVRAVAGSWVLAR